MTNKIQYSLIKEIQTIFLISFSYPHYLSSAAGNIYFRQLVVIFLWRRVKMLKDFFPELFFPLKMKFQVFLLTAPK